MNGLFYVISALIGLILGSFLSVLVPRLHHGEKGIVAGRSHCPHCKHPLGASELIPLLSYLLQRGQCRHCHKAISFWYPCSEILSTLSFLGMAFYFKDPLEGLLFLPLLFTLLFIFLYDLRYKEIHEGVLIPGILYALGWAFFTQDFTSALAGATLAFSFFGLQFVLSKGRWLGSGDIEIGVFLGLILGLPFTALSLLISYLLGSTVGIFLLLSHKASGKTALPLGPFLVLGSMLTLLYGNTLIDGYLSLLY